MLEEMMDLRSEFAFNHAIKGFGMDFEKALDLLRNHNDGLTKMEKEQRNVLVAALDNLVDFAVAEEFQMFANLPDDLDIDDEEDIKEAESVFYRYNNIYSSIENGDIEYAMGVAAGWVSYSENTVLTYMTQGDNRVRPWHLALEGTSYRKANFPAWLIPPIEHGCRCFLVEEASSVLNCTQLAQVVGQVNEMPDFINPVFKESVAKGGRIFSSAHSYFSVPKKYKKKLRTIANRIKGKWLEKQ
ncbi:hypothetical protein [Bacteroides stercoris]|uniref:hypothetical protein n=1 Tax=Bacteroides stercoris TaxID=46506 RepID=UPI001E55BDB8|nr:hypothetical protein [Bacteroides stercoris]MDC2299930.1 hypothetical protein [Bacteroides stercoris]MDC2306532.1 hypothetical protein [Bacteroides stercoris]